MMHEEIYLDHAATSPLAPEALEAMLPWLAERHASASSPHTPGRRAAEAVEEARASVARLIGAGADEIFFTGGGTEANNWAIRGAAARGARRIVLSTIEHHSVIEPCRALEREGARVDWVGVDGEGLAELGEIEKALSEPASLLCLMHANNEIGTIQPVEDSGRIARARGAHFHVDAVQTAGHVAVDAAAIGCDTLALAAHKLGGPKGVGALYVRKGVKLENLMHGGGQEGGRRPGTANVAGIVGFGRAAELALERMAEDAARVAALRDRLIRGIEESIAGARLNGHRTRRLPNNVSFTFEGVDGGELVMRLDLAGIFASPGSACASGSLEPSHVLTALGRTSAQAHGALRLTLGRGNGEADVARVLEVLPGIVEGLR